MFTDLYHQTLSRSQAFHKNSVNWAGDGTWQYLDIVKNAKKKHSCTSMLDYGCGKGSQYPTFAKKVGIESYDLYDPAWFEFEVLPERTWDLVLCFDVLPFVPESDIDTVLDLLNNITDKICIIGLQPITPYKTKKPFVCIKDYNWWQEKISSREKLALVWHVADEPFVVSGGYTWLLDKFLNIFKKS